MTGDNKRIPARAREPRQSLKGIRTVFSLAHSKTFWKRITHGFTLIEIILVITLLALLASLATTTHRNAAKKARETVLKNNLQQIRATLDQYNVDKGHYPQSLQSLVDEGYLRELPVDPITESRFSWEEVFETDTGDEDSSYIPGLYDVRSGSQEQAIDGTIYSEW